MPMPTNIEQNEMDLFPREITLNAPRGTTSSHSHLQKYVMQSLKKNYNIASQDLIPIHNVFIKYCKSPTLEDSIFRVLEVHLSKNLNMQ